MSNAPPLEDMRPPAVIRLAGKEDLPSIAAMGLAFFKETGLEGPMHFIPEKWTANWSHLLGAEIGRIWILEEPNQETGEISGVQVHGCFGAIVAPDLNDGALCVNEAFWWMHPAHRGMGLHLWITCEAWARAMGAERMTIGHTRAHAAALARLYERRGYVAVETHYVKHLKPED